MDNNELIPRRALWIKFLTACGLRSSCCGAPLFRPPGWPREYCSSCNRRIR